MRVPVRACARIRTSELRVCLRVCAARGDENEECKIRVLEHWGCVQCRYLNASQPDQTPMAASIRTPLLAKGLPLTSYTRGSYTLLCSDDGTPSGLTALPPGACIILLFERDVRHVPAVCWGPLAHWWAVALHVMTVIRVLYEVGV